MTSLTKWARTWHWRRGLRALLAIGSAIAACHAFGLPSAAAALGAFAALIVDSGGPYRPRLATMLTVLIGGAVALVLGCILPGTLWAVVPATLAIAFVLTYARVLSQPLASTSVLILVLYFAGLGSTQRTLAGALAAAQLVLLGGGWAILLSLVLWPVDPFRPARLAIAHCYRALAEFTQTLAETPPSENASHDWQRHQRIRIEDARAALSSMAARAPSRIVRTRALAVLLETSDILLARTMRLTELASASPAPGSLQPFARWLSSIELAVAGALEHRPADAAESFAPSGSHTLEYLQNRATLHPFPHDPGLQSEESETLSEFTAIFEAVRALWTGIERTRAPHPDAPRNSPRVWIESRWRDALRASWTLRSVNMRHALRLSIVAVADVLAMRAIHVNHGFWLPMTSIILMQPYSAGTNRKSVQRVTGTIAGGVLAAILAAALPGPVSAGIVITLLAGCTLATFAVDYALYCFFLTPTFVLMSLPHLHDWRYAGIRIATTLAGAAIAITAMRLLWPERAEAELAELLHRGLTAEAAYLRAVAAFLATPPARRKAAERNLLAPARRACGLASNDAEEAVDRVLQEPHFIGHRHEAALAEQALVITTFLRRLTQSLTTLAPLGQHTPALAIRLQTLAARLEGSSPTPVPTGAIAPEIGERLQSIERQAGVLQRALATLDLTHNRSA